MKHCIMERYFLVKHFALVEYMFFSPSDVHECLSWCTFVYVYIFDYHVSHQDHTSSYHKQRTHPSQLIQPRDSNSLENKSTINLLLYGLDIPKEHSVSHPWFVSPFAIHTEEYSNDEDNLHPILPKTDK